MTRIKNNLLTIFFVFLASVLTISVAGMGLRHKDDKLYEQIVTIEGKVEILNHPSLGKTAGSDFRLLFQKVGCDSCLIATAADIDGNYRISVSRGRYRVIARDILMTPSIDLLAPNQPRYINAIYQSQRNEFNIEVLLPKQ